jgi:hypothetical protein
VKSVPPVMDAGGAAVGRRSAGAARPLAGLKRD